MMNQNPYNQYKETSVQTATPERLMFMLFDGGIKFLKQAEKHIEDNDLKTANEKIKRGQEIVNELMVSLDFDKGGEIAKNLFSLYEYMLNELIQANIKKDKDRIARVRNMLTEMKETFQQAQKTLKNQKGEAKQAGGVSGKA
ncbi:flagellar export chaperone FliS [Natranaerofaba carboxydovora]|uniref:flagellar export chaperone FliS n=1 Tax=Natranaerofaba carboxydovora TaxID=2742683 RepID=UPI001F145203|nr:flagellar export chaperone FliS [Natranaerofaba carboxydovora]UMZ74986.1 Flagellar protein FliS [Natranaerofaba carboxydovora]